MDISGMWDFYGHKSTCVLVGCGCACSCERALRGVSLQLSASCATVAKQREHTAFLWIFTLRCGKGLVFRLHAKLVNVAALTLCYTAHEACTRNNNIMYSLRRVAARPLVVLGPCASRLSRWSYRLYDQLAAVYGSCRP
eukprot:4113517-Pleurochrysis_carterae.AAC.2